jgi:hypothetical protein
VSGTVERAAGLLSFRATLSAPPSALSVAEPAATAVRRHDLWKDTCAELFLREEGRRGYVEVNLSPAGHWNVYRFDAPRTAMREEAALAALPFEVRRRGGAVAFSLDLPLLPLFPPDARLKAAVCAVVRTSGGAVSHWALAHASARPDFHRPDTFLLSLPPRG